MKRIAFLLLAAAMSAMPAVADDWLQFRGPGGLGIAPDTGTPVTWSSDKNIAWKTELPGAGASSAIVVGRKIFLTSYSGYAVDRRDPQGALKDLKRHVICLDRAKGTILWKRDFDAVQPEERIQTFLDLHGYASSTPVSDGKHVYVFLGASGVVAFDLDGKQIWHVSVGKGTNGWGSGTSPILYKNTLIVNASVESGALVALDQGTGKEAWRSSKFSSSWNTPILVKTSKGNELALAAKAGGKYRMLGFDPDNGKDLWHADTFTWYICPSGVAQDGVIYGLQHYNHVAVRAGGRGDVTKTHTVWNEKGGSVVSSGIVHDGHFYWAGDNTANCVKISDGSVAYKERLQPNTEHFYASPVVADGKIYYLSRAGDCYVVEASPKYKLLAHNALKSDGTTFNACPAVSNSQLLLRSDRYLYCIGKEK